MDFFVTSTADSGSGSLRQAIMDANGNAGPDRILIQTTGTLLLLSPLPDITDSVVILGPGADSFTVDGNAAFRPFQITAPVIVTITGIAVRNGRAGFSFFGAGGAIFTGTGAQLTVMGSTFSDNRGKLGGAAGTFEGSMSFTDCLFVNNTASSFGGAIDNDFGTVTLRRCTLSHNTATRDSGCIDVDIGVVIIDSCALLHNTATTGFGGGVGAFSGSTLIIHGSTVQGNTAMFDGGGLLIDGSVATITNSRFMGNSGEFGGAVATENGSTTTITGSALVGNTALVGAAVFTGFGAFGSAASSTRLTNCTLAQNHAAMAGGAIFDSSGRTTTLSFATVADNRVDAPAGAALETGGPGSILVKNSIVATTTDAAGAPRANCAGTIADLGGNLSTDETCPGFRVASRPALRLGPLALNPPGNTETMALLRGSVAINAAAGCTDAAGAPVTADQRGVIRPQGRACDVGAFEAVLRFGVPAQPLFSSEGTCARGRVRRPFRPVTF